MQIVDNILHKLNSIDGLETVFYESGWGTNLRIDRKPTPAAVLYMLQTYNVSLNGNTKKDSVELEVFIFDRVDLAAKGEVIQEKLDDLQPFVNQFIALLANDKSLVLDGDTVEASMAYGQFDAHVCGWSLQLKLTERQGICIDNNASGVKTVYITKNGEYDVTQYGIANVNVQNGEILLQEKTATENGVITPDLGFNGLSKVNVQVPQPSGRISVDITQNGTEIWDVTNYESIAITTDVPTQTCDLYTGLTATTNGIYDPLTYNKDGFSTFVVNIPQPQGTLQRTISTNGTQTYDVRLWENIEITTAVPDVPCQLETLNITAAPSQLLSTYTPSGEGFDQVNIDLQLSTKYENHTLQNQYDSVGYDVRDNDYIYINLDASMLPQQCYGDLPVTITNTGIEYVNCCGYDTVTINTSQIQGINTWKGTWADYILINPKDTDTLYLITD